MTVSEITLIILALIVCEFAVIGAYERLLTARRRELDGLIAEMDEARDLIADLIAGEVTHPSLTVVDGGKR